MSIPIRFFRIMSSLAIRAGLPMLFVIAPPRGSLAPKADRLSGAVKLAQITEESLPRADLPSPSPGSGGAAPGSVPPDAAKDAPPGEWERAPSPAVGTASAADAPAAATGLPPDALGAGAAADHSPIQSVFTANPQAEPSANAETPPSPALDVSTASIGPDLGTTSLEPEIRKASTTPARAASLRLSEQARLQIAHGRLDEALRNLGRAVSIDPGDPFEYYYLGRAYLARKNYSQAMTFFQRAELGFASRPEWLGETLSFEGVCEEQMGHPVEAARAYHRAIAAAPGNFRAQAGFGRTGASITPPSGLDLPPPSAEAAAAAPARDADIPPPLEAPPPPPD